MDFFSTDLKETFEMTCPHLKEVTTKLRMGMEGVSLKTYPTMEFMVAAMCFLRSQEDEEFAYAIELLVRPTI